MSTFLSALLLAATATATLTTTIRMPEGLNGYYDGDSPVLNGSIVAVSGGKTTIAFDLDGDSEYDYPPETYTFQDSTIWEALSTTSDVAGEGGMTASIRCDMPTTGTGACTFSYNGEYMVNMYCDAVKSATAPPEVETYLYTYSADESGPESVQTDIHTYDYTDAMRIPEGFVEFCKTGGSILPDDLAISTVAMSRSAFKRYTMVVTAGEEKLKATAGAAPSNSGAQPTGTAASVATSSGGSPTGAGAPESTGAAALMGVPALAGLGAAVAAFLL